MPTGVAVPAGEGDGDGSAGAANGVDALAGVGVRMMTEGGAVGRAEGVASERAATAGFAVAFGVARGAALEVAEGDGAGDFSRFERGDGFSLGDVLGAGEAVAGTALSPGSGVNVGAVAGACAPPVLPKNFVRRPPSSNPPSITRMTSGTIGTPPPRGGSGSKRRRRG